MSTIVHTSTRVAVVVDAFHTDIYAACDAMRKAEGTTQARMMKALKERYGDVSPTFEQYSQDQRALAHIAKDKGMKDNQWVRKPFARAVKTLYNALPVAMTPQAVDKRAQRAAAAILKGVAGNAQGTAAQGTATPVAAPVGAPKGQAQEHPVSKSESIEQLIARAGLFEVLEACTRILADERKTAEKAKALASLTSQLRRESTKAA